MRIGPNYAPHPARNSGNILLNSILILTVGVVCLAPLTGVAGGTLDGTSVGDASATIPEPATGELVVVQSYSLGSEPGTIQVTSTVHVGDEIRDVRPTPPDHASVTGMDGFDGPDADGRLRWDGQTQEPSFEWRYEANRTSSRFDRLTWAGTDDWAIAKTARPTTWMRYAKGIETSRTYLHRTEGPGVAGSDVIFLGEHTAAQGETDVESIRIVLPDAVSTDVDPRALMDELLTLADRMNTGGTVDDAVSSGITERGERPNEVLGVVGPAPLSGGVTTGENFWVGESRLVDSPETAFHEYAHTRQRFDRAAATDWTIEGGAVYYAALYEWLSGHARFQDVRETLARGEGYDDASLANPRSWAGTSADYRAGGLTVAALDAELRRSGSGTIDDVYARLNEREDEISGRDFAEAVDAIGGDAADGFLERYVRGTDRPPVPTDPYLYRGMGPTTDLGVDVDAAELTANETGTVRVRLENSGPATSVAPAISLAIPDDWTVVDVRGGAERDETSYRVTAGTATGEAGVATTDIRPGENRTVAVDVAVPDRESRERHTVAVEAFDVGNNTASDERTVATGPSPWMAFVDAGPGKAAVDTSEAESTSSSDGEGERAGFVPVGPVVLLGILARIFDYR